MGLKKKKLSFQLSSRHLDVLSKLSLVLELIQLNNLMFIGRKLIPQHDAATTVLYSGHCVPVKYLVSSKAAVDLLAASLSCASFLYSLVLQKRPLLIKSWLFEKKKKKVKKIVPRH